MEIKVLGTGCSSCKALYETTKQAISELGCDATLTIPKILILLLILSLFYNLKTEFDTRIHYKSIQRSINIPENRIRYTTGIYSIKAGLPSVGEVFKVSIQ